MVARWFPNHGGTDCLLLFSSFCFQFAAPWSISRVANKCFGSLQLRTFGIIICKRWRRQPSRRRRTKKSRFRSENDVSKKRKTGNASVPKKDFDVSLMWQCHRIMSCLMVLWLFIILLKIRYVSKIFIFFRYFSSLRGYLFKKPTLKDKQTQTTISSTI